MTVTVVVGAQWGDEGKGKIVDLLAEGADVVARYQGGPNAGHTVVTDEVEFVLHAIPSGILHKGKRCIIGNGVVIDPRALLQEMTELQEKGVEVSSHNLAISDRAHLILPYHRLLDQESERWRAGQQIGTTGRGIGPSYADKMARVGLRMGDLLDWDLFQAKVKLNLAEKNCLLRGLYGVAELDFDEVCEEYYQHRERLQSYVCDTGVLLRQAWQQGEAILCEGAQGSLLDVDHGTYPFVTSSNATASGACSGLGLPPSAIDQVLGVVKAYTTRVGAGPFPTELQDETGLALREWGREYGATTGRPRRCGWFDAVIVCYAAALNDLQGLSITKLDVLDQLPRLYLCTAYRHPGRLLDRFPSQVRDLAMCEPVYEEMEGWCRSTVGLTAYSQLPKQARRYVERISELVGVKVTIISTGPHRRQTILL